MPYPKASQTATIVLSETGGTDFLRIRAHVTKSDEPEGVLQVVSGSIERTRAANDAIYTRLRNETQGVNYFGYPVGTELTKVQIDADAVAFSLVNTKFAAAEFTTAGGDTSETFTITGLKATDSTTVTFVSNPHSVTVVSTTEAAGQVVVVFSADPQADTVVSVSGARPVTATIINQ